jgi:hypothetical protein
MFHRLRSGLATYRFTVPQDVSSEYQKQTAVEFKRQEVNRDGSKKWTWTVMKGKANHLLDCEQMNLVAAMLDARLRAVLFTTEAEPEKEELAK